MCQTWHTVLAWMFLKQAWQWPKAEWSRPNRIICSGLQGDWRWRMCRVTQEAGRRYIRYVQFLFTVNPSSFGNLCR